MALILLNVGPLFIPNKTRAFPIMLALDEVFFIVSDQWPRHDINRGSSLSNAFTHRSIQILDLSKSFISATNSLTPKASVVFNNSDQRIRLSADAVYGGLSQSSPGTPLEEDDTYHGYDPNSKTTYVNKFHWNSNGYFDHDYNYRRPEGVHRIVVVGDSFVEAVQVPLSHTFHKLIEANLNSAPIGPGMRTTFEVIALGDSGTGQLEHFRVLRERAHPIPSGCSSRRAL